MITEKASLGSSEAVFFREWKDTATEISAQSLSSNQQQQQDDNIMVASSREELIDEAERGDLNILFHRPGKISFSFLCSTSALSNVDQALGCSFLYDEVSKTIRVKCIQTTTTTTTTREEAYSGSASDAQEEPPLAIRTTRHHGLSSTHDSSSTSTRTVLQQDDVLEFINNFSCRGVDLVALRKYLLSLQELSTANTEAPHGQGRVFLTLCFSTTNGSPHLCQSLSIRPSPEILDSLNPSETTSRPSSWEHHGLSLHQKQGHLVLQAMASSSCFGNNNSATAIQPGDILVGISQCPCITLAPQDAELLLDAKTMETAPPASAEKYVSITTIAATSSQRRWTKIRRASVAFGGGAMVGAGAIIMATPLHPLGHAMAVGGVGLLGTEFDAPRRVFSSFRRFGRKSPAAADEEPQQQQEMNPPTTTSDEQPSRGLS